MRSPGSRAAVRLGALLAAAAAAAACGDPVLVLGDSPGILRLVAGVPDTAGTAVGPTALESQLAEPRDIAVGSDRSVFVASSAGRAVHRFEAGGAMSVVADMTSCDGSECLERPVALALDGTGGLYIADITGHEVFRLTLATGALKRIAGTGDSGIAPDGVLASGAPLSSPSGLAVGPSGLLYIAEAGARRVRRIEADGSLRTVAGSGVSGSTGDGGPAIDAALGAPVGLAIVGADLYIADRAEHRVRRVDLEEGTIETVAGAGVLGFGGDGGPATGARLDSPGGVAVSPGGLDLFIGDTGNQRVRRVNLANGRIETFAGNGETEYNGPLIEAGSAALSGPRGVATNATGQLFIADTGHHIVWRTTIAR